MVQVVAELMGALALLAVESFGGRFLTRSTSLIQSREAGLQLRTILVEFNSHEIALAAHRCALIP